MVVNDVLLRVQANGGFPVHRIRAIFVAGRKPERFCHAKIKADAGPDPMPAQFVLRYADVGRLGTFFIKTEYPLIP